MISYAGYFIKINNISNEFYFEEGYKASKEEIQLVDDIKKINFKELAFTLDNTRQMGGTTLFEDTQEPSYRKLIKKYQLTWVGSIINMRAGDQDYIINFPAASPYLRLYTTKSDIGKYQYTKKCWESLQYCQMI